MVSLRTAGIYASLMILVGSVSAVASSESSTAVSSTSLTMLLKKLLNLPEPHRVG